MIHPNDQSEGTGNSGEAAKAKPFKRSAYSWIMGFSLDALHAFATYQALFVSSADPRWANAVYMFAGYGVLTSVVLFLGTTWVASQASKRPGELKPVSEYNLARYTISAVVLGFSGWWWCCAAYVFRFLVVTMLNCAIEQAKKEVKP